MSASAAPAAGPVDARAWIQQRGGYALQALNRQPAAAALFGEAEAKLAQLLDNFDFPLRVKVHLDLVQQNQTLDVFHIERGMRHLANVEVSLGHLQTTIIVAAIRRQSNPRART